MSTLLVPYHLDESMSELPQRAGRVITAEMPPGEFWSRIAPLHGVVADAVADADRPAVIAGDCTVALGVVAGLRRRGVVPAVVWFDAHGDLHTPQSSASNYPGGMPLRRVLDQGVGPVWLVGARDLDPPEAEFLAATDSVQRAEIGELTVPDGPIYLHIDLDVLDPAEVPGFRFPAERGPSAKEIRQAARRVLDTGRVVAMTLVCSWQPGHGASRAAGPLVDELLDYYGTAGRPPGSTGSPADRHAR
ncbi:arginase family protein [Amycolatopsis albispora]|uniref:Arginase n=1 Tax=Amycolatopsis albispora TaxID=1804986 RepID=A0A344L955_9PSEU|nr:arginase family protein [Amycolatopsis albispora]AXB44579.1 hypothetical protein A4R43_20440 [Amycolatopsis albispora]